MALDKNKILNNSKFKEDRPTDTKYSNIEETIKKDRERKNSKLKQENVSNDESIQDAMKSKDDDEAVLKLEEMQGNKANDTILDEFENSGLINQGAQAVTYSVENLYVDKKMKKFKNRYQLKANPPILKIQSSKGDTANFYLTQNFTNNLITVLTDVQKGYSGLKKTHQHTDANPSVNRGFDKVKAYIKQHSKIVILSLVWLATGLFYSSNFPIGSIIMAIVGVLMIVFFNRHKKDEED